MTTEHEMQSENEDGGGGQLVDTTTLGAITAAEIDRAIATARKFPRSIAAFRTEVRQMACLDEDTAASCTYALPRRQKNQDGSVEVKNIVGPSARFAEIVASAWGNCRVGARIVAQDAETITAQGVFHDLQRNMAINFEVQRRITDKRGRRYSADLIATTGNAASSIAMRNAILKGVPKAYWRGAWDEANKAALGTVKMLSERRQIALSYFKQIGVSEAQVLAALGVKGVEDLDLEKVAVLRAWKEAIKEGDQTVQSLFGVASDSDVQATPDQVSKATAEAEERKQTQARANPTNVEVADGIPAADEPKAESEPRGKRERKSAKPAEEPAAEQGEPEQEAPAAAMPPLSDRTKLFLPHHGDAHGEPSNGDVSCDPERDLYARWIDGAWMVGDADKLAAWVADRIAKNATQHCKRARMERDQAMVWAQETTGCKAKPAKFGDLTLVELVRLAEAMDG